MPSVGSRSPAWLPHEPLSRRQAAIAAAVGLPLLFGAYAALLKRRKREQPPTSFAAFLKQPADGGTSSSGAAPLHNASQHFCSATLCNAYASHTPWSQL